MPPMLTPTPRRAYNGGMMTTRTVLYDAETGERITASQPALDTSEHRKEIKGWVLRYRTAYGRRTGHKIRVVREPVE
jgi:hypothetical protein